MTRLTTLAKGTAAFLVLAIGVSFIVGSLMGGGFSSRVEEYTKGVNNDPRSILVQAVLIESDQPLTLPAPGSTLDARGFDKHLADAAGLDPAAARVRTPSILVQHDETGSLVVKLGDRVFNAAVAPRVIDTKAGPVLRVALTIERSETDSSNAARILTFATAYTAAPGAAVVLSLADLGMPGSTASLALRTTLIDPTPRQTN